MPSDEMVEKARHVAKVMQDALNKGVIFGQEHVAFIHGLEAAADALEAAGAGTLPVTPTNRTIVGGFLNNGDGHGFTVDVPITRDERAAIRKEAFEEAAEIAKSEADRQASFGCAQPEGHERDKTFTRATTAEAIYRRLLVEATAIRARGET